MYDQESYQYDLEHYQLARTRVQQLRLFYLPTKLWPFLLLLLVLSILDVIQIVLTSGSSSPGSLSAGTSTPPAQLYGYFLHHLPWGATTSAF